MNIALPFSILSISPASCHLFEDDLVQVMGSTCSIYTTYTTCSIYTDNITRTARALRAYLRNNADIDFPAHISEIPEKWREAWQLIMPKKKENSYLSLSQYKNIYWVSHGINEYISSNYTPMQAAKYFIIHYERQLNENSNRQSDPSLPKMHTAGILF